MYEILSVLLLLRTRASPYFRLLKCESNISFTVIKSNLASKSRNLYDASLQYEVDSFHVLSYFGHE